ncbi:hypothetical protein [Vogesella mureinivorans]|jgi:hypothetical protein|uniref:hypothetical protein n=1 Tax=Vogesella mureinivorans TaxID=657276 RepID=UPI001478F900|nr:hypothetical protein [Vogesella mureinivorans]
MSRLTYILYCLAIVAVSTAINYASNSDDGGSYRSSGGYYGGSGSGGFSGGHK